MLEARLSQADILKKVLDAVKELVTDANFDCSDEGIKLQAMDNSHVALISLHLNSTSFQPYRCDRNMSLGMSIPSLTKIIKCAGNDDIVTLRADESQDVLALLFESKNEDRVGEYEMKLMDIDQEHLGIPDTVYDAEITLPATEFARIIRDLKELGESVKIEVTKEGVRFSSDGDIGSASVTLKQTDGKKKNAASDDEEEDEDEEEEDEEEEEEDKEDEDEAEVKDEDENAIVPDKDEKPDVSEIDTKPLVLDDDDEDDDEEPVGGNKKRKSAKKEPKSPVKKVKKEKAKKAKAPAKKSKGKGKDKDKEETPRKVSISLQQSVNLTFSIKYLSNFAKSTPLSDYVHLHMSNEVPLLVEYPFEAGHIRYYLAPKISDE